MRNLLPVSAWRGPPVSAGSPHSTIVKSRITDARGRPQPSSSFDHVMAIEQDSATALVTGAGLRLGRAIALDLAKHGWRIGVHHHTSSAEADDLVREIEQLGSKAVAMQADLTREDQLVSLVQRCADRLGPPTCLVNNAARFEWDTPDTVHWAGWQAELDINLRAPIFLTQAFARALPEDASGSVINMIDQRVLAPHSGVLLLHHRQVRALDRHADTRPGAGATHSRQRAGPRPGIAEPLAKRRRVRARMPLNPSRSRRHGRGNLRRDPLPARRAFGDRADDRPRRRPASGVAKLFRQR